MKIKVFTYAPGDESPEQEQERELAFKSDQGWLLSHLWWAMNNDREIVIARGDDS